MSILICKSCGGDLEINASATVGTCTFCNTKQTLPKSGNEMLDNLFNRANALRLKGDFDKAEQLYEKILQENEAEPEAHWGMVLCKYGIEYVEDPKTYKRIPTCHRTSYDAVTADAEYKAAIQYADAEQKAIYEAEAKAIDEIQKNILSIVKDEKPFDVFICYKESDENGKRTMDSAIANDIYHQLTQEGLKVFYAAITLEDKLGREYEPYIFAALNSANVMLVIGTKPRYFSAVWVKNEWSRFLKLMKSDRNKLLIPCYKDMDAYELPEEFAHLQAQDMSKIGFINDIVRGIKKVTVKDEPKPVVVQETIVTGGGNTGISPLLKRAFMFLEDKEWARADEFCEQVLNIDPENAEAYTGKLLAELKICKRASLADCAQPFDGSNNYQKVLRFGDEALKNELQGYIKHIKTRNEKARLESAYRRAKRNKIIAVSAVSVCAIIAFVIVLTTVIIPNSKYNRAVALMEAGNNGEAAIAFGKLKDYKDAEAQSMALWEQIAQRDAVSAGEYHTVGLKADGTVVAAGWNQYDKCDVSGWRDIVAISAGDNHTVGLKSDGTVVAVGKNYDGQCDVSGWTDIVAVSAGGRHTVGLKSDGTVVAVGWNGFCQCYVSGWTDIVAISAGSWHAVGLKADGTVVAVGYNDDGRCDVSGWRDIVAISAVRCHTVGLKADGTVVAVGWNDDGQCDVSGWRDIVAISAGYEHTVGLNSDGTVVAVGSNGFGQCDVSGWTDIKTP